jgi:hypothetical protein
METAFRPTTEQWEQARTAHEVLSFAKPKSEEVVVELKLVDGQTVLHTRIGENDRFEDLGPAEPRRPLPTTRQLELAAQIEVLEEKLARKKNPIVGSRKLMYRQQLRHLRRELETM